MRPARIYPWRKMHRSRAPSIAPGTFFVAQSWADCITNMAGFNLRQAQVSDWSVTGQCGSPRSRPLPWRPAIPPLHRYTAALGPESMSPTVVGRHGVDILRVTVRGGGRFPPAASTTLPRTTFQALIRAAKSPRKRCVFKGLMSGCGDRI
jgi:hypothetical protein